MCFCLRDLVLAGNLLRICFAQTSAWLIAGTLTDCLSPGVSHPLSWFIILQSIITTLYTLWKMCLLTASRWSRKKMFTNSEAIQIKNHQFPTWFAPGGKILFTRRKRKTERKKMRDGEKGRKGGRKEGRKEGGKEGGREEREGGREEGRKERRNIIGENTFMCSLVQVLLNHIPEDTLDPR